MRLGIVVVYLVKKEDEKLLELHLSQIEKHTQVPYKIYSTANRLIPELRKKLENHPKVRICDCPSTELRGSEEHAYYLDHLIRVALEDGVTHIVTLHVDSFPIRPGWAQELEAKLSETSVLAAVMRDERNDRQPMTACMFFDRNFHIKYRPAFLLSEADLETAACKEYLRKFPYIGDSGIGYGFKIYSEGLTWYPLQKSNRVNYMFLEVHGDLIAHLGGITWRRRKEKRSEGVEGGSPFFGWAPMGLVARMWRSIPVKVRSLFEPITKSIKSEMFEYEKQRFLQNPESFLEELRNR